MKYVRGSLVAIVAVLVAAVLAGSASANRLSYSSTSFRVAISSATFEEEGGGFRINCPVTMAGSFSSSTFAKTAEAVVGRLTTATVGEASCTGEGRVEIEARSLPTEISYSSFAGTLPNITELNFRMKPPTFINRYLGGLLVCTYAAGVGDERTIRQVRVNGRLTSIQWIWRIPGVAGNNGSCPKNLKLTGNGMPVNAESVEITVSLI